MTDHRAEVPEDDGYGYCNSCGEEMWEGDECCPDGEWTPLDKYEDQSAEGDDYLDGLLGPNSGGDQ